MAAKAKRTKVEDRVTIHRSREGSHEVTVARVVETTECDRLAKVADDSQKIGDFLDWLQQEHDVELPDRIERLLAEYFDIDLDKVEQERRGLLAALQESHGPAVR